MRYIVPLAGVALTLMVFNGCSTSTRSTRSSEVPRPVAAPSVNTSALQMEVAGLRDQTRLAEMRSGGDISGETSRLRAEAQRLMISANSVGGAEGQSLRQQLDYVNARLDQLDQAASLRAPEPTVAAPPVAEGDSETGDAYSPQTAASTAAKPADPYASRPTTAAGASTAPLPPTAKGPYDEGKSYFDQKQFREAIEEFKSYLAAEPKGGNAAAAQFYIGESLYSLQQYEEAILEYQKVVRGFPKSSQVPTSLLKQGLSFQSIGDKDSAKLLYQKVVRDFPKSYAAGVAKERLNKI